MTGAPEPPSEAVAVFGDRLDLARRYADLLATTGISHGLVGPREAGRLWERHLVNCAAVGELLPEGASVADIGSGAGLPGLVLAVLRPDLDVHLVEPLLRRTTWLETAVAELELSNVTIHRGRAAEVDLMVPFVTARAVASLDKLVAWSFPMLEPEGLLLALKGAAAADELEAARAGLERLGVPEARLRVLGDGVISEPVRVVEIARPASYRARDLKEAVALMRGEGPPSGRVRDRGQRSRSRGGKGRRRR